MKRAFFNLIAVISAFVFPWWITVVFVLVGLVLFNSYFEIVIIGLIIDVIYGAPVEKFNGFQYVVSFSLLVVYAGFEMIKDKIRIFSKK